MNSNIEIVTFDNYDNEDENDCLYYIENHNNGLLYINNLNLDQFDSEYLENLGDTSQDTNKSFSTWSDNSITNSCSTSLLGETIIFSENFKNLNINESYSHYEKILNNSFSYNASNSLKFKSMLEESVNQLENKKLFYDCIYEGCKKIYKSKENLNLHIKNIHLKEKPYVCKYCPALFSHRNGIYFFENQIFLGKTYHERKFHTKFLPHKCSYSGCDLCFASKSALTYHLKSQHANNTARKISRLNKSKFNEKILNLISNNENRQSIKINSI